MKKLLGVLLGFCLIIPALMAADVSDINKQAWLSHIKEMNVMRRQIIEASKKANNSAEDMAAYNELMAKFETKQAAWEEYITAVANDDAEGRAKVENRFEGDGHHPRFHKGHRHHGEHGRKHFRKGCCGCCKCEECKCEKCECCKCEKCECRKMAPKCEKKCDKCCGKCKDAEKKCMKGDKCGKCCKKAEKKCMREASK